MGFVSSFFVGERSDLILLFIGLGAVVWKNFQLFDCVVTKFGFEYIDVIVLSYAIMPSI